MIYVASLDTFQNLIKSLKILKENPNLRKTELRSLEQLIKDTNIIIKPADKGSTTFILDKEEYIAEGIRQLQQQCKSYSIEEIPDTLSQEANKN